MMYILRVSVLLVVALHVRNIAQAQIEKIEQRVADSLTVDSVEMSESLLSLSSDIATIPLGIPRIVPTSPTAVAMTKFQSYPVDHLTGVPDINIPLYEIVSGDVSIPISMSYHASGLKPKDGSGLVGTGWMLNFEPSIARTVQGIPDEEYFGWFNDPDRDYPTAEVPDCSPHCSEIQFRTDFTDNIRDTQPDKYTYKLPNGGGSGYFIDRTRFLTIPRTNDKIDAIVSEDMVITDPMGIRYIFDGDYEKSGDIITRWMCKSIWSPNNTKHPAVEFSYTIIPHTGTTSHYYNLDNKVIINTLRYANGDKRNLFSVQRTNTNEHYLVAPPLYPVSGTPDAQFLPISDADTDLYYPILQRYIAHNNQEARLNAVDFQENSVSVSYKSVGHVPYNSDVLDEIIVRDRNSILVRRIKFYITPYNGFTSLTKLDSIIISAPDVEERKYAFSYHHVWEVPSILTVAVDHWGFCNGAYQNNELTVPGFSEKLKWVDPNAGTSTMDLWYNYSGAYREPDHEWTRKGVLTSIIDPQGLRTTFEYEGNFGAFRQTGKSYGKDYLYPVGGIRIKRIETTDLKTHKGIYRDYQYGLTKHETSNYEPVWGGGAIKHIVTIRDYIRTFSHRYKKRFFLGEPPGETWTSHLRVYSSMPESNIAFKGGSAVLYNLVQERTSNSVDDAIYKTSYRYDVKTHNFENVLDWSYDDPDGSVQQFLREQPASIIKQITRQFPANPHEPSDDYVHHYALTNQFDQALIGVTDYRGNELASTTKNEYETLRVWGTNIAVNIPYRLVHDYTDRLTPDEVVVVDQYVRDESTGKAQTIYYLDTEFYRVLDKQTTSTHYDVDGRKDIITTVKKYDYKYNMVDPLSSLRPRRIETINSDQTVVIDSFEYLNHYPAVLSRHKHIEKSSWKESRILFRPNSSLPHKVQFRTNRMPVYRDEVTYTAYDDYGNVTELIDKTGMPTSFVWGYNGQFPLAKFENASIAQVYNGTNSFQNWAEYTVPPVALWSNIALLRTTLPKARITTFDYEPLKGVVSIIDPNNITTKFQYDNYSRLTDSYYMDKKSPSDIRKVMLQQYIYKLGK